MKIRKIIIAIGIVGKHIDIWVNLNEILMEIIEIWMIGYYGFHRFLKHRWPEEKKYIWSLRSRAKKYGVSQSPITRLHRKVILFNFQMDAGEVIDISVLFTGYANRHCCHKFYKMFSLWWFISKIVIQRRAKSIFWGKPRHNKF